MEEDKEFLHWIMQSNPLDNPDNAHQPTPHHTQQQRLSHPTMGAPQQTPHPQSANVYAPTQYPNGPPVMYGEHFYPKQGLAALAGSVNQGAQQPQTPYPSTSNSMMAPPSGPPKQPQPQPQQVQQQHYQQPQQQQHHHHYHPSHPNQIYDHHQQYQLYQQQQHLQHDMKPANSGRLSDDDEEHYTDAQLKMMTSKERRQLRNKISARNFRNRRKEYIASLEGEVAKFKNENSQLRLEIKWVRTTMNKLQKENDHLRVKLALCHGGIKTEQQESTIISPDHPPSTSQGPQPSPPTASANSMPTSSLSPPPPLSSASQHEQSHHVLPISNANVSQMSTSSSSSLNLQPQNGNSPPDHNVTNRHLSQQHQQHKQHSSSSPSTLNDHQPISPGSTATAGNHRPHQQQQQQQQQHTHNTPSPPTTVNHRQSVFTTSPPQGLPGSIDTIYSDSSSSFASHQSPPNFADLADAWDLVIPNEFSSYCPPSNTTVSATTLVQHAQSQDDQLFFPNMTFPAQGHHPSYSTHHGNALTQTNMSLMQQQQQPMNYPTNQTALYRPPPPSQQHHHDNSNSNNNNNNSYVSSAVVPAFDFGNILSKQQQRGEFDNNLFRTYPLLVPALMSIVIGHTMSMSTDELLTHTRLLATPARTTHRPPSTKDLRHCLLFGANGSKGMMMMTPGLRSQSNRPPAHPLSKKQVHAMWESLLDQMVRTKSKQRRQKLATTVVATTSEQQPQEDDIESEVIKEMVQSTMQWNTAHDDDTGDYDDDDYYDDDEPWYDMPVTGFKAICPLYWMQRQFCRFVITYVVVKYPHLEDPCKTYLPICEQFRRRAITN